MTVPELLADMKAAHAARTQYRRAAERLAERAIRLRQMNDPRARAMGGWSNTLTRWAKGECE